MSNVRDPPGFNDKIMLLIKKMKTYNYFRTSITYNKQILSITYEIYKSFENGFKGAKKRFLDKAFDKVWHQGIIFKLRQNGILSDLLNILSDI